MEDHAIVDLYWSRNPEAIQRTGEKYGSYCRAVAWNILADRRDAEECVNDTWLGAWNAIPENRPHHTKSSVYPLAGQPCGKAGRRRIAPGSGGAGGVRLIG